MKLPLSLGLVLGIIGCGGGLNPSSTPNDAALVDSGVVSDSVTTSDTTTNDTSTADASTTDTSAPDTATPPLPACLGDAKALVVSSSLPFTDVKIGTATGAFLVDFGTTRSTIDLAAFATPPTATGCNPALLGQSCSFAGFDFFGGWGTVTLVTADHSGIVASVREAGILGTDFLSVNAFTLDYAGKRILRAQKATFCPDSALTAAGLVALPSTGFYSSVLSTLKPLSDVVSGAAAGTHVPNVPTVPLRVAGATAVAQLDTGFDDALVPYSINVNAAFYDAIVAKSPTALVRAASKDLSLSTCVSGVSENVEAYTLASGVAAELLSTGDVAARRHPSAVLFVKRTPSSAKVCGGIGTWTAPAAQVAGSFFVDAGVMVFDPFGSRVWVRPKP